MKSDLIDRRIAELESELVTLRQRKVTQLREELTRLESDLNGGSRPAKSSGKGWAPEWSDTPAASPPSRSRKVRRSKRLSDDDVVARLRKAVVASGSGGISARAAALQANI